MSFRKKTGVGLPAPPPGMVAAVAGLRKGDAAPHSPPPAEAKPCNIADQVDNYNRMLDTVGAPNYATIKSLFSGDGSTPAEVMPNINVSFELFETVQNRFAATKQTLERTKTDLVSRNQQYAALQVEMQGLREDYAGMQRRAAEVEETNTALHQQAAKQEVGLEQLRKEVREVRTEMDVLEDRLLQREEELQASQNRVAEGLVALSQKEAAIVTLRRELGKYGRFQRGDGVDGDGGFNGTYTTETLQSIAADVEGRSQEARMKLSVADLEAKLQRVEQEKACVLQQHNQYLRHVEGIVASYEEQCMALQDGVGTHQCIYTPYFLSSTFYDIVVNPERHTAALAAEDVSRQVPAPPLSSPAEIDDSALNFQTFLSLTYEGKRALDSISKINIDPSSTMRDELYQCIDAHRQAVQLNTELLGFLSTVEAEITQRRLSLAEVREEWRKARVPFFATKVAEQLRGSVSSLNKSLVQFLLRENTFTAAMEEARHQMHRQTEAAAAAAAAAVVAPPKKVLSDAATMTAQIATVGRAVQTEVVPDRDDESEKGSAQEEVQTAAITQPIVRPTEHVATQVDFAEEEPTQQPQMRSQSIVDEDAYRSSSKERLSTSASIPGTGAGYPTEVRTPAVPLVCPNCAYSLFHADGTPLGAPTQTPAESPTSQHRDHRRSMSGDNNPAASRSGTPQPTAASSASTGPAPETPPATHSHITSASTALGSGGSSAVSATSSSAGRTGSTVPAPPKQTTVRPSSIASASDGANTVSAGEEHSAAPLPLSTPSTTSAHSRASSVSKTGPPTQEVPVHFGEPQDTPTAPTAATSPASSGAAVSTVSDPHPVAAEPPAEAGPATSPPTAPSSAGGSKDLLPPALSPATAPPRSPHNALGSDVTAAPSARATGNGGDGGGGAAGDGWRTGAVADTSAPNSTNAGAVSESVGVDDGDRQAVAESLAQLTKLQVVVSNYEQQMREATTELEELRLFKMMVEAAAESNRQSGHGRTSSGDPRSGVTAAARTPSAPDHDGRALPVPVAPPPSSRTGDIAGDSASVVVADEGTGGSGASLPSHRPGMAPHTGGAAVPPDAPAATHSTAAPAGPLEAADTPSSSPLAATVVTFTSEAANTAVGTVAAGSQRQQKGETGTKKKAAGTRSTSKLPSLGAGATSKASAPVTEGRASGGTGQAAGRAPGAAAEGPPYEATETGTTHATHPNTKGGVSKTVPRLPGGLTAPQQQKQQQPVAGSTNNGGGAVSAGNRLQPLPPMGPPAYAPTSTTTTITGPRYGFTGASSSQQPLLKMVPPPRTNRAEQQSRYQQYQQPTPRPFGFSGTNTKHPPRAAPLGVYRMDDNNSNFYGAGGTGRGGGNGMGGEFNFFQIGGIGLQQPHMVHPWQPPPRWGSRQSAISQRGLSLRRSIPKPHTELRRGSGSGDGGQNASLPFGNPDAPAALTVHSLMGEHCGSVDHSDTQHRHRHQHSDTISSFSSAPPPPTLHTDGLPFLQSVNQSSAHGLTWEDSHPGRAKKREQRLVSQLLHLSRRGTSGSYVSGGSGLASLYPHQSMAPWAGHPVYRSSGVLSPLQLFRMLSQQGGLFAGGSISLNIGGAGIGRQQDQRHPTSSTGAAAAHKLTRTYGRAQQLRRWSSGSGRNRFRTARTEQPPGLRKPVHLQFNGASVARMQAPRLSQHQRRLMQRAERSSYRAGHRVPPQRHEAQPRVPPSTASLQGWHTYSGTY